MEFMKGTIICILVHATAFADFTPRDYSERCKNAPDEETAKAAIQTYLRRIPKMYDFCRPYPPLKAGGITFTAFNITGLGDLWPFRPHRIYCVDNRGVVEASLYAAEPLQLILGIKTCSGAKANLTLSAASAKVAAVFNAESWLKTDGNLSVTLASVHPEDVENVALSIQGPDGPVKDIVRAIGLMLNPHLETLWRWILRSDIQFIMDEQD